MREMMTEMARDSAYRRARVAAKWAENDLTNPAQAEFIHPSGRQAQWGQRTQGCELRADWAMRIPGPSAPVFNRR